MALIVVLFGFTLLSAAGLVGFAADDAAAAMMPQEQPGIAGWTGCGVVSRVSDSIDLAALPPVEAKLVAAGDGLFKGNCAQCHAVNEVVVGPALSGITKRRPISWILPWIKNFSKVVASGDDYAVALFTKFNQQQMPSFDLSDKEIASIVAYIKAQESASIAVASAR